MKKLFVLAVVVLCSTLFFNSCSKDNDKVSLTKERNINVCVNFNKEKNLNSSNWLSFNSCEDYERAIAFLNEKEGYLSLFEQDLHFSSMRCVLSESQREAIGVEDDILATLLNPDGFIQIDNFVFQIDIVNIKTCLDTKLYLCLCGQCKCESCYDDSEIQNVLFHTFRGYLL